MATIEALRAQKEKPNPAFALAVARREDGASVQEVQQSLVRAGFDPSPINHLL